MPALARAHAPALNAQDSGFTPPLRLLFWETTTACNLVCRHCRRLETSDEAQRAELSTEAAMAMIDDIASIGRPIMVFSGGEPLLRPDCFELIARARLHGLPVALASNGSLIDQNMADRIAASGVQRVSISIDGADAATHDGMRGVPGSFVEATAALRRLRAAGVSTQLNVTITRLNVAQCDDIYALAESLGVDALHCFVLVPVGCGVELPEAVRLDSGEIERFLLWLSAKADTGSLFVKATCAPQYHRILHRQAKLRGIELAPQQHGMSATTKGCLAGSGVCFVSHRGEVFPCGYLPTPAGHIAQEPLSRIWRESLLFQALRDDQRLEGRCGPCDYRGKCGGCRARAYASTGNVFAGDDSCPYTAKATVL